MTKTLSLVFALLLTVNTFAAEMVRSEKDPIVRADKFTMSKLIKEIQELQKQEPNLTKEDTCLDEVMKRRAKLLRLNVFMPLIGAGETAGSMVVTTIGALALWGDGAWGTLAAVIVGPAYGFLIGAGTYVGLQISHIIKAIKLNQSARILVQARLGKGKRLERFIEKATKDMTILNKEEARKDVIALLVDADQSGKFCDASLKSDRKQRKFNKKNKLKHAIATKKELLRYVRAELAN